MQNTEKIKELISKGQLEIAIDSFLKNKEKLSQDIINELILHSAKYQELKHKKNLGLQDHENLDLESIKISRALLELINEISPNDNINKFKGNLKTITSLIRENQIDKAISFLRIYSNKYSKEFQTEVILIQSRYNKINKEYRIGAVNEDTYFATQNRIALSLLTIIKSLEEIQVEKKEKGITFEKIKKSFKNSSTTIIIAILGTIISLILGINSYQVLDKNFFQQNKDAFINISITLIFTLIAILIIQFIVDRKRKEKGDEILLKNQLTDLYAKALEESIFNPKNEPTR